MKYKIEHYDSGLVLFSRKVFEDERGFFSEVFRENDDSLTDNPVFVQDNVSFSKKTVLRGLHLQRAPYAQAKLVTCLKGHVFDVAVDLRPQSKTFKKHWVFLLNDESSDMLYIPKGFAHGFCALSEEALLFYKTTDYYNAGAELTLRWDDPDLGIKWPLKNVKISSKDEKGLSFVTFLHENA